MTFEEKVQWFFAPPEPEQFGELRSTLHQIRREAQDCLLGRLVPEDRVRTEALRDPHRLFATTMVLMAGVDLMAKFVVGDEDGSVRDRIVGYASRYMFTGLPSADEFAEVLYYGCRNPLLHSFNLRSKKFRVGLTNGMEKGCVVRVVGQGNMFLVSVEGVFEAFIDSLNRYRADLVGDATLQANFRKMYPSYGGLTMQTIVTGPVE